SNPLTYLGSLWKPRRKFTDDNPIRVGATSFIGEQPAFVELLEPVVVGPRLQRFHPAQFPLDPDHLTTMLSRVVHQTQKREVAPSCRGQIAGVGGAGRRQHCEVGGAFHGPHTDPTFLDRIKVLG
ncbi:MAG: hypothetical protein ACK559_26430, partial [bacterium]